MTVRQKNPSLFMSMPHACSYLPGRTATTLFLDPQHILNTESYGYFVRHGFRRSGNFIYRPHCQRCQACIPVRVDVNGFVPNRSQRRIWKRNQDIAVISCASAFKQEHFDLYLDYQARRHPGGGMDDPSEDKYINFLMNRHVRTSFYELRLPDHSQETSRVRPRAGKLLGVAIVDILPDGLSAVYTFFDPEESRRALGVFSLLWEIRQARLLGLPWLYLGYLIEESPKMAYKANYRPLQAYQNGQWSLYGP